VLLLAVRLLGLLEPVPVPVDDVDGRLEGVRDDGVGGRVDGASEETADWVALDVAGVGVGGRETVNVPLPERSSGVLREPEVLDPPPEVLDPPPEVLDPPPEVLELAEGLLDDGLRAPAYMWNCPEQAKYPTEKVTLVFP